MSTVYVVLINVILLFIVYLVLNHKINKNSTSALLDRYAREVENLIVELNRTLDDVLNLSEERVGELKRLIKKAEKALADERRTPAPAEAGESETRGQKTAGRAGGEKPGPAGTSVFTSSAARDKALSRAAARDGVDTSAVARGAGAPTPDAGGTGARGVNPRGAESPGPDSPDTGVRNPMPAKARGSGGRPWTGHLYDVRGKKVEAAVEEERRESSRPANIFERSRHLLSMGHSKDEIARMLNLSRAEMDFLASLHTK